jgi:nitroreductase
MNNQLGVISDIIRRRRSTKTAKMNGRKIPDEIVKEILALADWAPTHGRTEPWRFVVFSGDSVKDFCREHAELYKLHTAADTFLPATYEKLFHNGDNASHLVIAIMQRGHLPKIPALEEIAATAAAIQNVLLAATAAGIASFWSSGGMTHKPALRNHLGLFENDLVMGMLYLGYTDEEEEGKRNIPFEHKIKWNG